jgi:hypothetical protein
MRLRTREGELVTRRAGEAARERLLRDLPVEERRLDVDGITTSVLEGDRVHRWCCSTVELRRAGSFGE